MRRDHRRLNNRLGELRNQIAEWAAQNRPGVLEARVLHCLGARPRDTDRVHSAVAYALIAAPPGEPSLIEEYIEAHPRASTRMDRVVRAAWRSSTYRLLSIRSVEAGSAFTAEDAVTGETLTIPERTATDELQPGDWLLGFVIHVDGAHLMEGTGELLAPAAVVPVYAVLSAFGGGDGRAAAWPAMIAMHAAYVERPDGDTDGPDTLDGLRQG